LEHASDASGHFGGHPSAVNDGVEMFAAISALVSDEGDGDGSIAPGGETDAPQAPEAFGWGHGRRRRPRTAEFKKRSLGCRLEPFPHFLEE
jgi:hypothetical protein